MKCKKNGKKWLKDVIFGSIIGFLNGFLGSGGGMIAVPILEKIKKIDNKKAHATAIAVIFPLSIVSGVVYSLNFELDILTILILSGGVTVGGIVGSLLLKKLNSKAVRIIFAVLMLAAGIKMFF